MLFYIKRAHAMLDALEAAMLLDHMMKQHLRQRIDEALQRGDREAFMRLSGELRGIE